MMEKIRLIVPNLISDLHDESVVANLLKDDKFICHDLTEEVRLLVF
jgi:hypothetical protein